MRVAAFSNTARRALARVFLDADPRSGIRRVNVWRVLAVLVAIVGVVSLSKAAWIETKASGRVVFFAVTDVRVVDSRHTRTALDAGQPRMTLVTCYPFHAIRPGGPLRFVVTADLIAGAGVSPPPQVVRAAVSRLQT